MAEDNVVIKFPENRNIFTERFEFEFQFSSNVDENMSLFGDLCKYFKNENDIVDYDFKKNLFSIKFKQIPEIETRYVRMMFDVNKIIQKRALELIGEMYFKKTFDNDNENIPGLEILLEKGK